MTKILYIHIGTEKTGSTSIQRYLAENRQIIAQEGLLYLKSPGVENSRKLATYCMDRNLVDDHIINLGLRTDEDRSNWKDKFHKDLIIELKNIPDSASKIIVSSEHFHSRLRKLEDIDLLNDILKPFFKEIKIIVYLRRQDKVAVSLFSTACRTGVYRKNIFPEDIADYDFYYNYYELLEKWSTVFKPENIIIRIYERDKLVDNDLVADFMQILKTKKKSRKRYNFNTSLSGATQLIVSQFNKYFPTFEHNKKNALHDKIKLDIIDMLEQKYRNDIMLPKRSEAIKFYNTFKATNSKLAVKWLNQPNLFDEDFSIYSVNSQNVIVDSKTFDIIFSCISNHWFETVKKGKK